MGYDDYERDKTMKKKSDKRRSRSRSNDRKINKKYRDNSKDRDLNKKSKKDKKSKRYSSRSKSQDRKKQTSQSYNYNNADRAREMAEKDQMKTQIIQQELGYTNTDNPFGDKQLASQFIWKKKQNEQQQNNNQQQQENDEEDDQFLRQRLGNFGNEENDEEDRKYQEFHRKKQQERSKEENIRLEIQKVKQQRIDRQLEKEKLEEEKQRAQKEREDEQFQEFLIKEKQFQEDQLRIRALVRLNFGTEQPIDTLVKVCFVYREKIPFEDRYTKIMVNIHEYLKTLQLEQLEKIIGDGIGQEIHNKDNKTGFDKFWNSIILLSRQIIETRKPQPDQNQLKTNAITQDFEDEVKDMYIDKNSEELQELENEIAQTLQGSEFGVMDFEYWENIQKLIKIQKAVVTLQELYKQFETVTKPKLMDKNTIQKLKESNARNLENEMDLKEASELEESEPVSPRATDYPPEYMKKIIVISEEENNENIEQIKQLILKKELDKALAQLQENQEQERKRIEDNKLLGIYEDENDDEDQKRIEKEYQHQQQKVNSMFGEGIDVLTQQMIQKFKNTPLQAGEEVFNETVDNDQTQTQKNGQLLKRPQFFNRVKMGYDWNKYNQTHFDENNPPPRVVHGYKFNIFYTELYDQSITPEYFLEKSDDPKFFTIRFSAGPPYEDISFKIIAKEWDLHDQKGSKCVFSRGVLHLYFNFKRNRYRR